MISSTMSSTQKTCQSRGPLVLCQILFSSNRVGGRASRRAAREEDEMAALDAVGDYEADPNVMLEDVPQDIVIKTLKVSCACVPVLVFACVCVCVRARDVDMCS